MSLFPSSLSPASCSGLMYSGVPTTSPVFVTFWFSAPAALAMPKSTTFTQSEPSRFFAIMMLSGFRSRCTMPISCATWRPSAACFAMFAARIGGRAPFLSTSDVSDSPSMNSIAR